MAFTFHTDPGHGWLAVPTETIENWGLRERISHFSYISDDSETLYLEEDCDAQVFIDAWYLSFGDEPFVRHQHSDADSFIRKLRRT